MTETIPKGYKQTKTGLIPDDWDVATLAEISEIRISNVDKKSKPKETPVRLCNYMEVFDNEYITNGMPFMHATATNAEITKFSLKRNDVLFTKDSETREDIASTAVVIDDLADVLCGYHLGILRPHEDINGTFFAKILNSHDVRKIFIRHANGVTRFGLTLPTIQEVLIPLPSRPERDAIASILSTVDEAIATTEAIIARTEELKRGFMQVLLTRGIDEDGRVRSEETHVFKDSPIGRVPVEWDVIKFSTLCRKLINGGTPSTKVGEYWEGTIPWITGADVIDQDICEIRRYITAEAVGNSATHIVEKGNLLLVTRTGVGKVAIAPFDVAISQDITGIILNDKANVEFIFWILNRSNGHFIRMNQGTSINGIKRNDLNNFTLPLPPITEQNRLNGVISTVNREIIINKKHLDNLQTLKRGLMHDLLTGRVRVPEEMRQEGPSSGATGEAT